LAWAVKRGEAETALAFGGALWPFWAALGHMTEGRRWLTDALALDRENPAAVRALHGAAALAQLQGDPAAEALAEESLALGRRLGDRPWSAGALLLLGHLAAARGDLDRATEQTEAALVMLRELDDQVRATFALGNLGEIARVRGDWAEATARFEEAAGQWRQQGSPGGLAWTLTSLAGVTRAQGDHKRAARLYAESIDLLAMGADRVVWGLDRCFDGQADILAERGEAARAARLHGAAEALRETSGGSVPPFERPDYERGVERVRGSLGEDAFAAAWEAGRALPTEEAVAEALAVALPVSAERSPG
jgi:tetratricopeptide (TPR) repeat protein